MSLRLIRELRKMGATKITLEGFGTIEFGPLLPVTPVKLVAPVAMPGHLQPSMPATTDRAAARKEIERVIINNE